MSLFLRLASSLSTTARLVMAAARPLYLSEEDVKPLLSWDTLVPAIERVMAEVSDKKRPTGNLVQPPRMIVGLPPKDNMPRLLLAMPGYSGDKEALGCKLVTVCGNNVNRGLPTIMGTIILFDADTGKVQVIMEANEITAWRTAAASAVATKHLGNGANTLAVLGSGVQGGSHARVLQHLNHFKQIRIWNHRFAGAQRLAEELKGEGMPAEACESAEECVREADVIVTATYSRTPILKCKWVKPGVHINAVGAAVNHHSELDTELYQSATIYTDTMDGARVELKGLADINVEISGEVGEIVNGTLAGHRDKITIFHSLGMAVEDAVSAKLIHEEYKKRNG